MIKEDMEELRRALHKAIDSKEKDYETLLKISQELDKYIIAYTKKVHKAKDQKHVLHNIKRTEKS